MGKNAIILHGVGCKSTSYWYPYIKKELEKKGYTVWLPQLPNTDKADLKEWLPFVLKNGKFDRDTVLIGHSAGNPLILSLLEKIKSKVKLVIMIAGFSEPLDPKKPEPILQNSYNWGKIGRHAKEFIFINSDNDPWKCDDRAGRVLFDHLGGTLIIRHGEGHMGSDTFKQPYKKFPLLIELITENLG